MMDLTELSRELGLSLPQTRRRLEALFHHLNGQLDGKVTRGSRGKILVDATVAGMLRQVESLARDRGVTFTEALRQVAGNHNGTGEPSRDASETLAGRSENSDQALARALFWGLIAVALAIFLGLTLIAARL